MTLLGAMVTFAILATASAQGRGGATYVRWGRTVCAGDAQLVYKGQAGGGHLGHAGSGANYICLPETPQWGNFIDGLQGVGAYIYGAEYQLIDVAYWESTLFSKANAGGPGGKLHDQNVPCAVCYVPSRSTPLMIPAQTSCPTGWTNEYQGYLMSAHFGHTRHTFECMDGAPEVVPNGALNEDGAAFYPSQGVCGSLKCPNYIEGRELTCVVCSK